MLAEAKLRRAGDVTFRVENRGAIVRRESPASCCLLGERQRLREERPGVPTGEVVVGALSPRDRVAPVFLRLGRATPPGMQRTVDASS